MQFLKEHLSPGNYEWKNEMVYIGEPSRRLYNRHDGDQTLFIINQYAAPEQGLDLEQGLLIQQLLKELPVEAKSERSVLKWLNEKIST